jgi:hypothetical protein
MENSETTERQELFSCSQDELKKTIWNLYKQCRLPRPYHLTPESQKPLDNYVFRAEMERLQSTSEGEGEYIAFEKINGVILVGEINSNASALTARSTDPRMFQFFDMLVEELNKFIPLQTKVNEQYRELLNSTGKITNPLNGLNSRGVLALEIGRRALKCPREGSKRRNDWKAAWRKIKGHYKGGTSYQKLAEMAEVSKDTVSKIVKAGDAGLLD